MYVDLYGKNYYSGINDLPAYNWFEINENFRHELLCKNAVRLNLFSKVFISELWKKIYYQYIEKFGMSDEFVLILSKKKDLALKKLEKIMTEDRSLDTLIEVAELELKSLTEIKTKSNYLEIKTMIEKYFNFHLDLKNISVAEFYTYLQVMKKQNGRSGNKA